ncbi:MAG: histidine triad family protein [Bryobacterales bacterium]|jgi:histidine triad (HIT) family protein|nr:histidine triad family protein [Bryobacterales bacterium]
MSCVFCDIASGKIAAEIVWRGDTALAFLDHRPLFPGHVLLIPDQHIETLADLPVSQIPPYFEAAQRLHRAVETALGAQGTFIAINNRVSQSVPHLHTHIVPRRKGDGLKGFFWPRHHYESDDHLRETAAKIRSLMID